MGKANPPRFPVPPSIAARSASTRETARIASTSRGSNRRCPFTGSAMIFAKARAYSGAPTAAR